ncbi:uncharacterized protein LOC129228653 [Uloborus diversus]|uniref:uncharacterized protein LOC129228653 n=1 Tax=Uloborus diversus TaxID=327109 RepID=UPI0024098E3D|nr:uncharacterized protein LOC129228653 [Uloborus diversus]
MTSKAASVYEKAKKKRATIRAVTTKILNKISEQLNNEDVIVEDLSTFKLQLNSKLNQIQVADAEVENLIEDMDEFENEIEASQEYSDKILNLQFDIESRIEKIKLDFEKDNRSTLPSRSGPFQTSTSINLPKFDLPAFNGNVGFSQKRLSSKLYEGTENTKLSHHSSVKIDEVLQKFWELESIPQKEKLSIQDANCDKFYSETTTRDDTGRYEVKLPFKEEPSLGNSRDQAVARFLSLERKLIQNPSMYDQYKNFMREYLSLNHMELVQAEEIIVEDRKCFYMPHHGVIREHSSTTKLRVVFDASAKSSTNISLNDVLHAGPKLQTDLFYILLNFRIHSIALAADIEKMFRQILVSHSDSDFQKIIWRENPDQKIEDYRLKTVTYGTACAPYLAIRTIKKLAEDEEMNFPKASKVIDKDFYVDDLLTGADSIQEAENLMSDLINLMRRGGFTLRKWISNEHSILSKLPPELKGTEQSINIAEDQSVKLLGIQWDPNQDTFAIHLNPAQEVTTKRNYGYASQNGMIHSQTVSLKNGQVLLHSFRYLKIFKCHDISSSKILL